MNLTQRFKFICRLISVGILGIQSTNATADNVSFSTGPDRMKILKVENRDVSTLIFMSYTTPDIDDWAETSSWMNIGDKTYLTVPGSSKKYPMISTINMPVNSEAENRFMMFDSRNQRHQFILEFEKIPDNCENFDLIEDANNSGAFNFYNVRYVPADTTSFIDIDEFIADYPVKEFGQFAVNGNVVSYVKFNDIIIHAIPFYIDQYGKYYNINLSISNLSGKSILFNPSNVRLKGYKLNMKKQKGENIMVPKEVEMELLSYAEYDKIVKKKQKWNNFWYALGEGLAAYGAGESYSTTTYTGNSYTIGSVHASGYHGNTYGYANAYGSSYTTTYGQSTTRSYNGAAAYAAQQKANENYSAYANNQHRIRQQLGDGYIKLHTIPSETEYSGYFNIKYRDIDRLIMEIIIDGQRFPFTF